jgi:Zn-dependent metalloprotease
MLLGSGFLGGAPARGALPESPMPLSLLLWIGAACTPRTAEDTGAASPRDVEAQAMEALRPLEADLGIGSLADLKVRRSLIDDLGDAHVHYQQQADGIPIWGGELLVTLGPDGTLDAITEAQVEDVQRVPTPLLSAEEAMGIALSHLGTSPSHSSPPELWLYRHRGRDRLVWLTRLEALTAAEPRAPLSLIDARTGELLLQYDDLQTTTSEAAVGVGSGDYRSGLPLDTLAVDWDETGDLLYYLQDSTRGMGLGTHVQVIDGTMRTASLHIPRDLDNNWALEPSAVEVHYSAAQTYDYFLAAFGRNGIDDLGGPAGAASVVDPEDGILKLVVLYEPSLSAKKLLDNAWWSAGTATLSFGTGSGGSYGPFSALDVVAHEFSHGVVHHTAGLRYMGESGALNEATADIFAAMVERAHGGTHAEIWSVGEDVRTPLLPSDGLALRYMSDPASDGVSPDHYDSLYTGSDDNGGVHLNSGVANLAFYLLSEGGAHPRRGGTPVVGIGADKAARLWYDTLIGRAVGVDATLADWAAWMKLSADRRYGAGSAEAQSLTAAWALVGICDVPVYYYVDADGDGVGEGGYAMEAPHPYCPGEQPAAGLVSTFGDCDDGDASIYPGAPEPTDGVDNDCDLLVDNGSLSVPACGTDGTMIATGWPDADHDGFGEAGSTRVEGLCVPRPEDRWDGVEDGFGYPNYVDNQDDCDDRDWTYWGTTVPYYVDADGDGWGDCSDWVTACEGDVVPGYAPNCEDCDDSDPYGEVTSYWFEDLDGDGWGSEWYTQACSDFAEPGFTLQPGDCDDYDPSITDQREQWWYADLDGDGVGGSPVVLDCLDHTADGWVTTGGDCDDSTASVGLGYTLTLYEDADGDGIGGAAAGEICGPGAAEGQSTVGGDCDDTDATVGLDGGHWCEDRDGDGVGNTNVCVESCDPPAGYVRRGEHDCDDLDATYGAELEAAEWYPDEDVDGLGDGAEPLVDCWQPEGYVGDDTDCDDQDSDVLGPRDWYADEDGDGYGGDMVRFDTCLDYSLLYVDNGLDCDDSDPESTYLQISYPDGDGDGYGDRSAGAEACGVPEGYVEDGTDCRDADAAVSPGATEQCNRIDDDCDGLVDDADDDVEGTIRLYDDSDRDGLGDPDAPVDVCVRPSEGHYSETADDCDPYDRYDPTWYVLDADMDGVGEVGLLAAEPPIWAVYKCDEAGWAVWSEGHDCDDTDPEVQGESQWIEDADVDDHGSFDTLVWQCESPGASFVHAEELESLEDCDDGDATRFTLTGIFEDDDEDGLGDLSTLFYQCRGTLASHDYSTLPEGSIVYYPGDDALDLGNVDCDDRYPSTTTSEWEYWYRDEDGDGYVLPDDYVYACAVDIPDYSPYTSLMEALLEVEDCDDTDPSITTTSWILDRDGDGYPATAEDVGAFDWSTTACEQPEGYMAEADAGEPDCDDSDATITEEEIHWPDRDGDGAGDPSEWSSHCPSPLGFVVASADAVDCDDDDSSTTGPEAQAPDRDGDGYGTADWTELSCATLPDAGLYSGDCDDDDFSSHPDGLEVCDGADNDCNDLIDDEALDARRVFADRDSDGWGDEYNDLLTCEGTDPAGYVSIGRDCDDSDWWVQQPELWCPDADGDGRGAEGAEVEACERPTGHVASCDDCDDADASVVESLSWYEDTDGDSFGAGAASEACRAPGASWTRVSGDCDDRDASSWPGGTETCDGQDNDCDSAVDDDAIDAAEWYADADGDGWGSGPAVLACSAPAGHVSLAGDCDAAAASISPGATESCGGGDQDCDGLVDEGLDCAPPTKAQLVIEGGAVYSRSRTVSLRLSASDDVGVTEMCLATSPGLCTAWRPYATAASWTFPRDGVQQLYATFRDASGKKSMTALDSIFVDSSPPVDGALSVTASGTEVRLSWTEATDGSGSGVQDYLVVRGGPMAPLRCDARLAVWSGEGLTATLSRPTTASVEGYRVCARDRAGHVSAGAAVRLSP